MAISPGRGILEKGSGEQLQQEFLGNTYSLSLLGPLHVLIWELSAAFTRFSSAGSPGLRGRLSDFKVKTPASPPEVFLSCVLHALSTGPGCLGNRISISGLGAPEAPIEMSSGFRLARECGQ